MRVRDILKLKSKDLVTISENVDVLTAMRQLIEHKISCLLVTDEKGRLRGILSDKDIFRAAYEKQDSFMVFRVSDLMTTNLIVGVLDDEADYIAALMTNNRIRHIPIVDRDQLIGLVSIGDVVKNQIKNLQVENRFLKQYIDGSYPG